MSIKWKNVLIIALWLAALWGGAYANHFVPTLNWQWWVFPYLFTCAFAAVFSVVLTLISLGVKYDEI
jgi:ABC-type polysaccharide/polyol phosphate export permease